MANPRKKPSKVTLELKNQGIFNPETVRQSVEIQARPKPSIEQIETIEKLGANLETNLESSDLVESEIAQSEPAILKKVRKTRTSPAKKSSSASLKSKQPQTLIETKLKPGGHILIITEKPQAASKIAAALSNGKDQKISNLGIPYYELERNGKRIIVACAVGHLFTLSQIKKEQGYPVFNIGWFPNFEVKKKDFTKKYYATIQKLVKNASEIIVATDFDTEGEVIGYNIVRFIAGQKDAKRMKFSSLTTQELQDSYDNVHPTIEWGQAIAGETRHFLDWLYGINLSRALMQAIKSTGKFKIMSIGRVQGPTLNLIVEREKEILAFKSTPYWQVFITINDGKNKTELKHNRDITKKSELEKFKDLVGKKANAITTKTKQTIIPPAPFDLTTLQTEAYKFHSLSPSQTLAIAQKLYLAGLISYPRTSSQKIPDAMMPKKILKELGKHFPETENAIREKPIEGKKSDPAHPAIIPTGNFEKLEEQDQKIYNLIVKRFISCYCDDAELENKKIEVEILGLKFNEKGMEIIKEGWMKVYPAKMEEKEIKDFNGEITIEKLRTEEKMTQPPKRFSPASILSELEKRNLGTKCLTEDTKIILNGNSISMKELFNEGKYISKENETEIREINGTTISLTRENHPILTSPKLISKRKLNDDESILEIETDSSAIRLTDDHQVYIIKNKEIKAIKAKEININDKIVGILKNYHKGNIIIGKSIFGSNFIIKNNEIKNKFSSKNSKGILVSKLPIKWSSSLAWVLGYYYGDGSYSDPKYNGSHQLCFTTTEKKALQLLKSNIKHIFGIEPYAYDLGGKYKVNCNCAMAYALIKKFPELNGKKPIKIPKEFIGYFLRGFFDADGNVHLRPLKETSIKGIKCNSFNTPRIKITLSNIELIKWVSNLLKELEIENKVNKTISTCKGKKFDSWTILISGRDKAEKFAYKIGFDSYKEDILYKGLKCDSWKYKILKNSALISLLLNKSNLKIEELLDKTGLSRYDSIMALRRLFRLGIISKKRFSQANRWIYSLKNKDRDYLLYCMKIIYKKIDKDLYEIPIKRIEKVNYNKEVYDLSIEENSPNFITESNILVHNSTRANILDTLYDRDYIKDKSIKATELGIRLIESLHKHSPIIIDENLTRNIEKEMDNIRTSKKDLEKKEQHVLAEAKDALTKISQDFKKNELAIGKELAEANQNHWDQQKEDNKFDMDCPACKKGKLTLKFSPRFRNYFIACTNYPECKQTYSLPSKSIIKKLENNKKCEECGFPMILCLRQGKKPWILCFNPKCPGRKPLDINGNNKEPEPRYIGK